MENETKISSSINRKRNFTFVFLTGLILLTLAFALFSSRKPDKKINEISSSMKSIAAPDFLVRAFPDTDWSKADQSLTDALNGGPGKDGIPALNEPKFDTLDTWKQAGDVNAIVIQDGDNTKVYPYNILVWHEIINDTVGGVPIAVTFCPLCGSAVVYDRRLPDGVSTFGVSGALVESNMIMYDRLSETLWQQSTGRALAGKYFGQELTHISFQLLTIDEVKEKYPHARVVSERTGYFRDYSRNPYGSYDTNEDFIFHPSMQDVRYPAKTIFVVFTIDDTSISVPWLSFRSDEVYTTEVNGQKIMLQKKDGELVVLDAQNKNIPFYFEMWFSWAVRHQQDGRVFDPSKQ